MKADIEKAVAHALAEVTHEDIPASVAIPADVSHGDYTSMSALNAAKKLGQNPREIAQTLANHMHGNITGVEKIEVLGQGFINFWLSHEYLIQQLDQPVETSFHKQSLLEYYENTQPNTNKPLHIGHLRNTALGEAIVHLRQRIGMNAQSVNINNDRGIHIIKAMYGYLIAGRKDGDTAETNWEELIKQWVRSQLLWKTPTDTGEKPDHFVGSYYVRGDQMEHGDTGETFKEQAHLMLVAWEDGDPRVRALWEMMNTWFYKGFRETHARFLGIDPSEKQFEKEWYESEIYEAGKQLVLDHMTGRLFEKREDGAIIAKLDEYALPDKVVIRKDGTTVYVTQDLELIRLRVQEDHASLVSNIVADEQTLYFKQLYAICVALGFGTRENFLHISYGMVNLKDGVKMSSRLGTAVSGDELMDVVKQQIVDLFHLEDETLAEQIMLGALKYWMLRYNPKAQISFDIDQSVNLGGNSGPYLQYTYARTRSVIAKSDMKTQSIDTGVSLSEEDLTVLRKLFHYQDAVEEAALSYSPNLLCNYLYELSQEFNLFYQKQPILKADERTKVFRLALTNKVGETIKHGLTLLGIPAPERM